MSRPRTFRAGGHNWSVEYFLHKDWPTEDDQKMGVTHTDMLKISIRLSDKHAKYAEGVIQDTLLHELMHVCFALAGQNDEEARKEEDVIRFLGPTLLAVLRDNVAISRYLIT